MIPLQEGLSQTPVRAAGGTAAAAARAAPHAGAARRSRTRHRRHNRARPAPERGSATLE